MGTRLGFAFSRPNDVGPAGNATRPDIFTGWWLSAFGGALAALLVVFRNARDPTFGGVPVDLAAAVALFATILRRAAAMPATVPARWLGASGTG